MRFCNVLYMIGYGLGFLLVLDLIGIGWVGLLYPSLLVFVYIYDEQVVLGCQYVGWS